PSSPSPSLGSPTSSVVSGPVFIAMSGSGSGMGSVKHGLGSTRQRFEHTGGARFIVSPRLSQVTSSPSSPSQVSGPSSVPLPHSVESVSHGLEGTQTGSGLPGVQVPSGSPSSRPLLYPSKSESAAKSSSQCGLSSGP